MQTFTRQSAVWARCSRVESHSIPRRPVSQRRRQFHVSLGRRSDTRPRNDSAAPASSQNEPSKHREETHTTESAPVGASVGASVGANQQNAEQDKTSTAEPRRSSLNRRTFRTRRVNEIPRPPPIPEWFLEHNVRLYRGPAELETTVENREIIRCVDSETGHELFRVPYFDEVLDETWRKIYNPLAMIDSHLNEFRWYHEVQKSLRGTLVTHGTKKDADGNKREEQAQNVREVEAAVESTKAQKPDVDSRSEQQTRAAPGEIHLPRWSKNQLRWGFLEAESGVRAAFSLADSGLRAVSFAVNRVDISLQSPDPKVHDDLDDFVQDLAGIVQADVIRLDANDIAELTSDYVGMGTDEPGSFANIGYDVFEGYEAVSNLADEQLGSREQNSESGKDKRGEEEEENDEEDEGSFPAGVEKALRRMRAALGGRLQYAVGNGRPRLLGIGIMPKIDRDTGAETAMHAQHPSSPTEYGDTNRDEAKLSALLDALLDAPKQSLAAGYTSSGVPRAWQTSNRYEQKWNAERAETAGEKPLSLGQIQRQSRQTPHLWFAHTARVLVEYLTRARRARESEIGYKLDSTRDAEKIFRTAVEARRRTIVHLRDLVDLERSHLGEATIDRLARAVQKRRRSGEQIIIVGTSARASDTREDEHFSKPRDESLFRTIDIPPLFNLDLSKQRSLEASSARLSSGTLGVPAYRRILEINLRHLQSMLRRLRPDDPIDLFSSEAEKQLDLPGMHWLSEKVLPLDHVQRLAVVAVGLAQLHAQADVVHPLHLSLAVFVTTRTDHASEAWTAFQGRERRSGSSVTQTSTENVSGTEKGRDRVDRIRKGCNPHETRLLSGVVDPNNIKTAFADVHVTPETIEALKTLTTLSLLRPDAFRYGVLANDRLPGLLLYGPPGTGKTMLAKAVAKESKAAVLEVSGAQIYEKYVGEGEKMVRAVFSLAKKLSPCVVFIDEADAIFGSRGNPGNRNTHREIINQFLKEWDGMTDHGVFIMVASNRPFDLDDAVLRRLPRRLLVDLPVAKDRESILAIHLRHELVDSTVSLTDLAKQTPFYSGSDLKNLAVAAALAAVREESETQAKCGPEYQLPEKRTLSSRHFEKAMTEISASISEDMGSLNAIRKFDERYGDRRGRKKKSGYGFGVTDNVVDESAARVRQTPDQSIPGFTQRPDTAPP